MQFNLRDKFLLNYLMKKIPPSKYQILKIGNCFMCNRDTNFDISKNIISSMGTCGIASSPELAKIKAISEFVEREAFKNSNAASSTGFAAYPFIFNRKKAVKCAKIKAFNEMVERYSLYMWAENNIKHLKYNEPEEYNLELYSAIQKEIPFLEYHKIIPSLTNINEVVSVILYAKTEYGWAFASAANKSITKAEQSALKELYISCIALHRIHELKIPVSSIPERRILWISQQNKFIEEKINNPGNISIHIPNALFKDIKTKYHDCYVVMQCYFEEYKSDPSNNKIDKFYL